MMANGDKIVEETIRLVRIKDTLSYDAKRARRAIARVLGGLKDNYKPIVLSEGGLTQARDIDRRTTAERLRDLFGPCQIIATTRNQLTCVSSLYFFLVSMNLTEDVGFEKWSDKQISAEADGGDAVDDSAVQICGNLQVIQRTFPGN